MSGDELINKIKSDPRSRHLRCVLLSGRTSDHKLVEILKDGQVYSYLEKNKTLLTAEGRADLQLVVRNAVQASRLEQERERLTYRLKNQVEAMSCQYHLMRVLLTKREPGELLRLVLESLTERIECRGVIGLVDLEPNQRLFAQVILKGEGANQRVLERWTHWARESYSELSGRDTEGCEFLQNRSGRGGCPPSGELSSVPVFLNQDIRGLLLLIRNEPLESEEAELFSIWRDQLQDALSRVHVERLDEKHRMELMIEAMQEGVVLTDEKGTISLMNSTARRILNIDDLKRSDFRVVVSALGLSSLEVLRRLGVGGGVSWRALSVGEAYHHVLFSKVLDHSGRLVGILTVIRDVSAARRSEQQREEFVHIIGHEIRGPLTSIGGVLELLSKHVLGEMSERQHEYVEMARDSCVKLNHLLSDLLDLAKFEQGKMPLSLEQVRLERVIEEAVAKFEPLTQRKQIKLHFRCLQEGLFIQADPYRLGQVVNNLLSNAIKCTPEGGEINILVFTSFIFPALSLVQVHNTGEEISVEDLERVFDKFEQLGVQDRKNTAGTGLGLSISQNIIHGHGGQLWVESGRGEGTSFVFALPSEEQKSHFNINGKRDEGEEPLLLLISADLQEALSLKAALMGLGFRLRLERPDPQKIAKHIAEEQLALAIYLELDHGLKKEVLLELSSHPDLPVVAMLPPGSPSPSIVDLLLDLPPDPLLLASTLNLLLSQRRHRRRMRILIMDRDLDWAREQADRLDEAGYLAYTVRPGELKRRMELLLPDLLLIDLEAGEGAELAQSDLNIPILGMGAEALPRKMSPPELLGQIKAALSQERRAGLGTLFALPGAQELQREFNARRRERQACACVALDIIDLNLAIQQHGFMWGHRALAYIIALLSRILQSFKDQRIFLGHQREDDFILLLPTTHCLPICDEIQRAFSGLTPLISKEGEVQLQLRLTLVIDERGHYERFSSLQADLGQLRAREAADLYVHRV